MENLTPIVVCRICANFYLNTTESDFFDIFDPAEEFQSQMRLIQSQLLAWELKISSNDGMPQRICVNCFTNLCNIEAFKQECHKAQEKLMEAFGVTDTGQIGGLLGETPKDDPPQERGTGDDEEMIDMKTEKIATQTLNANVAEIEVEQAVVGSKREELDFASYAEFEEKILLDPTGLMNPADSEALGFASVPDLATSTDETLYTDSQDGGLDFVSEASTIAQSKKMETEMEDLACQDLEEMLQGSIIQKTPLPIKTKAEAKTNTVPMLFSDTEEEPEADGTPTQLSSHPFACQYCYCPPKGSVNHLIFENADALSQHFFKDHDPNSPYTCPNCAKTFNDPKKRDTHMRSEHTVPEQCSYCKKMIRGTQAAHLYHCNFVDNWECGVCGEKFLQIPLHRFHAHQRQHKPVKEYKCKVCDRSFRRRGNMESHQRQHIGFLGKMLPCDVCKSAAFATEYELRRHKYQAHNGDFPVKCIHCNKGFVSAAFLQRHVHNFHPERSTESSADAVTCSNCNSSFTSVLKLRNHLSRPRDENGNCRNYAAHRREQRQGIYPCPHCAKRFHMKTQLEKHLNTHDARLRPFQCTQCHIRTRTAFELRQHIQVTHTNMKAFQCNVCQKYFGYKKDLRDHMLFHEEVNVTCSEMGCDYVCKNHKQLNDHVRHKHRLIPCEYCNEMFTRQRLTAHLRQEHRAEIDIDEVLDSFNSRSSSDFISVVSDKSAVNFATGPYAVIVGGGGSDGGGGDVDVDVDRSVKADVENAAMGAGTRSSVVNGFVSAIVTDKNFIQSSEKVKVQLINDNNVAMQNVSSIAGAVATDISNNNFSINNNNVDNLNNNNNNDDNNNNNNDNHMDNQNMNSDDAYNTLVPDEQQMDENYFMGSLLDPENEIVVT